MGRYARIMVEPPGPKAREMVVQDSRYVATSTKILPVAAAHAHGGVVTDVDGNDFLDFSSGMAVLNLGHTHPRVVQAVKEQADRLIHFAGTDFYYAAQVELARRLGNLAPGDQDRKVFFSNSGTESVEAAMKLARWNTGRKQFVAFLGCFHGRSLGSLSLTASKPVQRERFFPTVPGVVHMPYAYCYRCAYGMEPSSCGMHCARVLEDVYFTTLLPPEEVAALFIEPVQGEGGYIVPPREFIQEIAAICRRHGILLVDDEIQAGMGRTGRMWAIEHYDVIPDIMCTAKALGSGVPIAATIFSRRLDMSTGAHSTTYGGNLLACAASLATLDIIEEGRLAERASRLGNYLHRRLLELQERHDMIGDVRGLGLMQAIELVKDRQSKAHAVAERDRAIELAFKRGAILLPAGRSTIRFVPPLIVEEDFLDEGVDILDGVLGDVVRS
jgi:4-aminobutyrate aminotransferase